VNALTVFWIVLGVVIAGAAAFFAVRWSQGRSAARSAGPDSPTRARDLVGRDVLTISDAGKVGAVDDVLLDVTGREVVAFSVKGRRFGHAAALVRDQVAAVGPDAIMVEAPTALNDFKRLPALADAIRFDKLRGTRVVTQGGELLGTVWDMEVDGAAHHVIAFLLRGSVMQRLRHHEPAIPVAQVTHHGERGIMVVADDAASAVHGEPT
jgi:uncharacterized protein YrrD